SIKHLHYNRKKNMQGDFQDHAFLHQNIVIIHFAIQMMLHRESIHSRTVAADIRFPCIRIPCSVMMLKFILGVLLTIQQWIPNDSRQ
ncbi:hypothetical protein PMAYCL1PPCAC_08904, partial [Pristionchus mayeri]